MDDRYLKVYEHLLKLYGPQGWWPVTPIGGCDGSKPEAPIYGIKSKNGKQRLEIAFGALLTQNLSFRLLFDINQISFFQ